EVKMRKLSRMQMIVAGLVIAAATAVPIAIAQSTDPGTAKGHSHWGARHMRGDFFSKLNLTDAQKAQLKQIRENHSQTISPLMTDLRAKRQEIRQASQGATFDESLVAQKLAEIAPLEAKLMGERVKLHNDMLSVLTPDQKAQLDQARQQLKSKWAERHANKKSQ